MFDKPHAAENHPGGFGGNPAAVLVGDDTAHQASFRGFGHDVGINRRALGGVDPCIPQIVRGLPAIAHIVAVGPDFNGNRTAFAGNAVLGLLGDIEQIGRAEITGSVPFTEKADGGGGIKLTADTPFVVGCHLNPVAGTVVGGSTVLPVGVGKALPRHPLEAVLIRLIGQTDPVGGTRAFAGEGIDDFLFTGSGNRDQMSAERLAFFLGVTPGEHVVEERIGAAACRKHTVGAEGIVFGQFPAV